MEDVSGMIIKTDSERSRRFIAVSVMSLIVVLAFSLESMAGVLVAPTSAIMTENKRTTRLTIKNPSTDPKEVEVRFAYGLPESDSLGNVDIKLIDSAVTDPRSCMDWLKAFPRKIVVPPNGSQVIRLVANPPENLPEGEYWCRLIVRSSEGSMSPPPVTAADAITTRLNMIMETAIVAKYRKGESVARLAVLDTAAWIDTVSGRVSVLLDMESQGNVSYVGVINGRLLDARDREIMTQKLDIAVYRQLKRRLDFPVSLEGFEGPYRADIRITTRGRTDIAPEDVIAGNEISLTTIIPEDRRR
jgi:hypothetical protein